MIDEVFGPEIVNGSPHYRLIVDLTVRLIRGLAVTASLYEQPDRAEPLIGQWAGLVRMLLSDRFRAGPPAIQPEAGLPAQDIAEP